MIRDDLQLSVFRLYGSRDFTGSSGEIIAGPPGSNARISSWIDESQSNLLIETFGGELHANQITNLLLNDIPG